MHTCGPIVLNLFAGLGDPMIGGLCSPAARSGREKPFRPGGASYASRQSSLSWSPYLMKSTITLTRCNQGVLVSLQCLSLRGKTNEEWRGVWVWK